MATIENIITGGEYDIIEVASSPAAGAGTKSPLGSLAIVQDVSGSTAQLWQKTGLADTAWVQVANSTTQSVAWSLIGNAGTSASINFLGTTDAVDFVHRTTNLERLRILAGGSIVTGSTASAIYRTINTGVDELAHFVIDPANSLTSGNSYTFDSVEFGFARGNGARRIQRAAFMLSNLVDTAGAETGGLGIYTKPSTSAITERIRILPSGFTGINTINPLTRLDVQGTSRVLNFASQQVDIIASASTYILNNLSPGTLIITGTTPGQIVRLPNATTMVIGQWFDISNLTTTNVTINNNDGLQYYLGPNLTARVLLDDNSTAAGVWIIISLSNAGAPETGTIIGTFSATANANSNVFLNTEGIASSDTLPLVMPSTGQITLFTFTGTAPNPSGSIEFRVNTTIGTPALTVPLVGTQTQTTSVSLVANKGDKINCKIANGASNVAKPIVKIYI